MPDVHALRRTRAWQQLMSQAPAATALLVTSLPNIRYLTGFTGSNAALIVESDHVVLGTDARYLLQAAEQAGDVEAFLDRQTVPALVGLWQRRGGGVLAIESEHLSVSDLRALESVVGTNVIETRGVVEECRMRKEPVEIGYLEEACAITDAALHALVPSIAPGISERDIALRLEALMLEHGADGISFATIVAAGPHAAMPHHTPTSRPVEAGDLLLIDFGAERMGYHADETRTFCLGAPADWQAEVHAVVAAAQAAGGLAARAGAEASEVDRAARQVITDAGFGDYFGHGLGHGVGLEIHEAPYLGPRATGRLPAGSPVTIEPGVYIPGRGGVRIEDTILVSEGPSRSLTSSPRDLVVLG